MSVNPVRYRPTSEEQKDYLEVYALVKGFKSLSDFSLYAVVTMTAKNRLTAAQKAEADKLLGERRNAATR